MGPDQQKRHPGSFSLQHKPFKLTVRSEARKYVNAKVSKFFLLPVLVLGLNLDFENENFILFKWLDCIFILDFYKMKEPLPKRLVRCKNFKS